MLFKDKYNHVGIIPYVENFYDYLHLDREARDLISILIKNKKLLPVEELVNEADVNKAFRELRLHRIWKEDIVVSRENRDLI
jgi:hypothetical protein